jgi:uncharacterized protein (AIM24 family)
MMFMDDGIRWTSSATAPAAQGGLIGKLLGAGKAARHRRIALHDDHSNQRRQAACSPRRRTADPGDGPAPLGGALICQKDALCAARLPRHLFPAAARSASSAARLHQQRLDGDGLAFVHAGGTVVRRELQAGQTLFVDTGCIVALTPSVSFEVQYVGKIKTALFGGEGLFFAKVTGPGTVWLQSLPFSRLASRVFAAAPQRGGSREEGSVLGAGALGGVLGGIFGDDE